jgi:hypothetical protein
MALCGRSECAVTEPHLQHFFFIIFVKSELNISTHSSGNLGGNFEMQSGLSAFYCTIIG